ncbi:MAG TPA: dTDP-glucose 4,6-dehydratase [Terriglobia bacterium]|nr:dTDP-glucose 4,6-dehydratase [Terriglobia bacterium]
MRLFVTGGAGFIGSNFIRYYLQAHPYSFILNLDKLTYAGNLENLADVDSAPNYRFVRGDVTDSDLLDRLLQESFDAVVHFAAETHVDRSIADARDFVQTNVFGTYALLEAARRRRVGRFLYVGTDEVYGSMAPREYAHEGSVLKPNSPYAASKAGADLLARSFWQTYGFPVITTRCSNNYGPYQFPEKLMPLMIGNALEGQRLPVYGDGLNERDWIFVEDHCRALDRVLERGQPGEVYNIGFGQPLTNVDIIRSLLRLLAQPESLIDFVKDRPGHDRRYALETGKIQRELGWAPAIGIEEGLKLTVEWYRAHRGWMDNTRSGEYRTYYDTFYTHRNDSLARL